MSNSVGSADNRQREKKKNKTKNGKKDSVAAVRSSRKWPGVERQEGGMKRRWRERERTGGRERMKK